MMEIFCTVECFIILSPTARKRGAGVGPSGIVLAELVGTMLGL